MVLDVATGDYNAMLCLHCARRVVSPSSISPYIGLINHLKFRASFTSIVKLTFARIDGLIGTNLPMKAFQEQSWWDNKENAHSKGWLDAGWETQEVNLTEGYVVFKKVKDVPFKKGKKAKADSDKPFTPVPIRYPKRKTPSKTKVSKLYARIKNMERNRAMARMQIKGFKQRSNYHGKLFKPDEKPGENK
jgi:hypothetical protein